MIVWENVSSCNHDAQELHTMCHLSGPNLRPCHLNLLVADGSLYLVKGASKRKSVKKTDQVFDSRKGTKGLE